MLVNINWVWAVPGSTNDFPVEGRTGVVGGIGAHRVNILARAKIDSFVLPKQSKEKRGNSHSQHKHTPLLYKTMPNYTMNEAILWHEM